ncbi:MAG: HlyD family type I secretion periplasmic adaptor subunit, partial [Pseudomonadota bacterium]
LDPTQAQATRDMVTNQLLAYTARVQRLRAERDNSDMIVSPEVVEKFRAAGMEDDLEEQRREFDKRVARYQTEAKIYDQQVTALEEQIDGLEVQRVSVQEQMENLTEELAAKKKMVDRQLTPRSEYLRLKRNFSELEGRLGALTSNVGRAKSSIAEALEQKSRLTAQRSEQAVTELNNVRAEISSLRERRRAAEEVLSRITVRAPGAGTVVSLNKNTPGSVVRAGEDIAVILPAGQELIVEARMSPRDGSIISVGQVAKLRFSSLNARTTPEVDSEVTYVSADSVIDERTKEPYIVTRLKIPSELPPQIDPSEIYAGMPVETYVVTGDRTFAEYVIRPLVDSFNQGLRER